MKKISKNKQAEIALNERTYVTPAGFTALEAEYNQLLKEERPKLVETVRWAASNGDRSENGDYIYGKKRLREIDRRARYLGKRIENAQVISNSQQHNQKKAFFGATVTYRNTENTEYTVKIVGIDEADLNQSKISYTSPVAKALLKSEAGDSVDVKAPMGIETLKILEIHYEQE